MTLLHSLSGYDAFSKASQKVKLLFTSYVKRNYRYVFDVVKGLHVSYKLGGGETEADLALVGGASGMTMSRSFSQGDLFLVL